MLLNAFISKIFPITDSSKGRGIEISHKQMLQRLPTPLAQVKASNISQNLLNRIHQVLYLLY